MGTSLSLYNCSVPLSAERQANKLYVRAELKQRIKRSNYTGYSALGDGEVSPTFLLKKSCATE